MKKVYNSYLYKNTSTLGNCKLKYEIKYNRRQYSIKYKFESFVHIVLKML